MAITVEFWFDFSCPYAYLASRSIEEICARGGAHLQFEPMLLGGVFRAIGAGDGPMSTPSSAKAMSNARDMQRWAERRNLTLRVPSKHPMRTVLALRTLLGLAVDLWPTAIHALYSAYWIDGAELTDGEVVAAILTRAGLPPSAIREAVAATDTEPVKADLRARTDRAIAAGVFGAPAMIVRRPGQPPILLWGQDRLHWLEAVLAGWEPDQASPLIRVRADPGVEGVPLAAPPPVDFWFDFSSPFAYLGATQIAAVAHAAGATVRYRPMLLGALFRQVGTADVPLLQMPDAKRRYLGQELDRWARYWGVDFRFSTKFPLRSVTALRLVLVASDRAAELIAALFRAAWVDDLDIGDDAVLRRILGGLDLDPALVDHTREPAIKQALIAETSAAVAAGVFGAPTTIVHSAGGPLAFWGQDRLDQVAVALRGWVPASR